MKWEKEVQPAKQKHRLALYRWQSCPVSTLYKKLGREELSLESGILGAALPFAALPTAGTAPPWAGMLASTCVQQALSQDGKDPCGTFKAESSIC